MTHYWPNNLNIGFNVSRITQPYIVVMPLMIGFFKDFLCYFHLGSIWICCNGTCYYWWTTYKIHIARQWTWFDIVQASGTKTNASMWFMMQNKLAHWNLQIQISHYYIYRTTCDSTSNHTKVGQKKSNQVCDFWVN